ncbi:DUF1731 domain-containing protein, partial [bacterium]|nr:DUF1731 domain-containing protein [bacterium]
FLLRLVGGELAKEALLAGQRVVAKRLAAAGFAFAEPDLEAAFAHVLSANPRQTDGA